MSYTNPNFYVSSNLIYEMDQQFDHAFEDERRKNRKESRTRYWNELKADKAYKQHRKFKQSRAEAAGRFVSELNTWSEKKPVPHARFMEHLDNAGVASKASVRTVEIAGWFTVGVPREVTKALKELTVLLHKEVALKAQLAECEDALGNEPAFVFETLREKLANDEAWVLASPDPYGYEAELIKNGFCHYVPPSEALGGVALSKHMMANLKIRQVRIAHAVHNGGDMRNLFRAMMSFKDGCFFTLKQFRDPRYNYSQAEKAAVVRAYLAVRDHRFSQTERKKFELETKRIAVSGASEGLLHFFDLDLTSISRNPAPSAAPTSAFQLPVRTKFDSESESDGGVAVPSQIRNDSGVELSWRESEDESDGGVQLPNRGM